MAKAKGYEVFPCGVPSENGMRRTYVVCREGMRGGFSAVATYSNAADAAKLCKTLIELRDRET